MILPTVMATNPAAFHTRRYLAHRFHIDTIVSSHDPDRIFFSENTSIGEILLICRRWSADEPKPPTRVINLARNPATPLDALDTAARIEQASKERGKPASELHDAVGRRRTHREGGLVSRELPVPLLGASPPGRWSRTVLGSIPTVPMNQLADVGPAGQEDTGRLHPVRFAHEVGPQGPVASQD